VTIQCKRVRDLNLLLKIVIREERSIILWLLNINTANSAADRLTPITELCEPFNITGTHKQTLQQP